MEMRKSGVGRYILALLATVAALGLGALFEPLLGDASRYPTLWAAVAAVVFSAWCCGLSPSILTAVSAASGVWFLFLPPHNFFVLPSRADIFALFGFLLVSGFIVALMQLLNSTLRTIRSSIGTTAPRNSMVGQGRKPSVGT